MSSFDKKKWLEIEELYEPLYALEKNRRESSGRLVSNRIITDRVLLIENVNNILEHYKYLLHVFKTMGKKYDLYRGSSLPDVLRFETAVVVIDLPPLSTFYFTERVLMRKYRSRYFHDRFEYDFQMADNSPNQIFTIKVKNTRLYSLCNYLNRNNTSQETIEEIEYFLVTFVSLLSTIEEYMLKDWKVFRQ